MDPPIESHKRVSIPILDRLDRLQKRIPRRQRQQRRRATAAAAMETVKDFHHLRLHHPPANVSTICPLVASVSAFSMRTFTIFIVFTSSCNQTCTSSSSFSCAFSFCNQQYKIPPKHLRSHIIIFTFALSSIACVPRSEMQMQTFLSV